jgi:TPR repeat protein
VKIVFKKNYLRFFSECAALALMLCMAVPAAHAGIAEGVEAFAQQRYAQARKELAGAAKEGDAQAMAYMGEMLMRGLGGARDELTARDYVTRAQASGNARATYLLGTMHIAGNLVERDGARGEQLVREAAEKNEPAAQAMLGVWMFNGSNGYTKDEAAALAWFKAAAEQQNGSAMHALGIYAERGIAGVPRDNLVALDWFKKAGDAGSTAGMTDAGRLYALGQGVTADGAEALRWLRQAAARNAYEAFRWIGNIHEFGRGGVAKNAVLAYAWYAAVPATATPAVLKAAAEGRERLAKTMNATEIQEAEKQAKSVAGANAVGVITGKLGVKPGTGTVPRSGVYGSGVVVSEAGDILTNEHVISACARVRIQPAGAAARVVARDARNDLALLRVDGVKLPPVRLRGGRALRLGDDIVAIGYPLKGVLSSGAVVTTGIVNAMTGLNDDTSAFQISATVQPGSSGGPILDRAGNLAGIVRARLLPTAPANPQNVNFGINLATVGNFLDIHGVAYQRGGDSPRAGDMADMIERVRKSTVQVECY